MAKSRQSDVDEAINTLVDFHDVGRESLAARGERGAYEAKDIENEAKVGDINPDTLRKARQFADPERGYSRAELKALCNLIRRVQSSQDPSEPVFSKTHMIRAVSVPKKERMKLVQKAIKDAWSTAELETEIAKRFGTRREGGRRRLIPRTLKGRLAQLENMCEQWRRWTKQVCDSPATKKRRNKNPLLPPDLLQAVIGIGESMERLQLAVAIKLKKKGRRARPTQKEVDPIQT